MKLTIKPSEIIERCIWSNYHKYALKGKYTQEEIDELIKEDKEFEIEEHMAFVIGLLNRVYTPNIVYKLNQLLKSNLVNKSTIIDGHRYINIRLLEDAADSFFKNFPDGFESRDKSFNIEVKKLNDIVDLFVYNLNELETKLYKRTKMVKCKQVKKIINKVVV